MLLASRQEYSGLVPFLAWSGSMTVAKMLPLRFPDGVAVAFPLVIG